MNDRLADSSSSSMTDIRTYALLDAEFTPPKEEGVLESAVRSAAYTGIQEPVNGLIELAEKASGRSLLPSVDFIDSPQPAKFGTGNWHAQQIGSACGLAADFVLLSKITGKVAGRSQSLGEISSSAFKAESGVMLKGLSSHRSPIVSAATTGAIFEGVFRPVGQEPGNFYANRLQHALEGGITFGALSGTSSLIKNSLTSRLGATPLGRISTSEASTHALAGLPVGAARAQLTSALDGHGLATSSQTLESAYSFFLAGGALGGLRAAGRQFERPTLADRVGRTKEALPELQLKDLNVLVIEDAQGFRRPIVRELESHGITKVTRISGVESLSPDHILGIKPGKNAKPFEDTYDGNQARIVDLRAHEYHVAMVDGDFLGSVKTGTRVVPELKRSGVPVVIAISGGGAGNPPLLKAGADLGVPKEFVKPLIHEGKLDLLELARHPENARALRDSLTPEIEALRKRILSGEDLGSLDMST